MFADKSLKIYKDIKTKARENKSVEQLKKIDDSIVEKSSSGSSIVYVSRNHDNIFQLFLSSKVSDRIAEMMIKLKLKSPIKNRIYLATCFMPKKTVLIDETIIYDPFEYIVPFKYYIIDDDIIAWGKITPLNSIPVMLTTEFLQINMVKLCYDISNGLYALKTIGIIHNDCRLDNIGIYKYNFVLFDFDGSGTREEKDKDFSDDYIDLTESFKNRGIVLPFKFTGTTSVVQFVSNDLGMSLTDALKYLKELRIVIPR